MNCYRPVYRDRIVSRGRRVYVGRYLLGAYLLVEMVQDWLDQFVRIIQTPGIRGILMCDEKPLVARNYEVDRLRLSEIKGYVPAPDRTRFRKGQDVVVSNGPFAWFDAKYKRARGDLDVVEVSVFGAPREITLPAGCLEAA